MANSPTPHPSAFGVEAYIVEVDGKMGPGDIEKIKRGMWLGPEGRGSQGGEDRSFSRQSYWAATAPVMEIIISTKPRDSSRDGPHCGRIVRDLNRVAIGGKVTIKGLDPGEFRPLTEPEIAWLWKVSSAGIPRP